MASIPAQSSTFTNTWTNSRTHVGVLTDELSGTSHSDIRKNEGERQRERWQKYVTVSRCGVARIHGYILERARTNEIWESF